MATLPVSGWDALYQLTDQPKKMTLAFSDNSILTNSDICMEQMSLEESLCSEENLRFGCCESSCFQVRIVNTEKNYEGLYLNVIQGFPAQLRRLIGSDDAYIVDNVGNYINGADMYYAKYGNFRVVSDKPTGDRVYRDLTCYDKMYDIIHANVYEWYADLTFPMTVKDFRDSFFEYLNVQQVETELINDDFIVAGEFYVMDELSGQKVVESICEINGAFGHINRDGLFEYITLPSEDTIEYPHYVNGSCVYEDYETDEITGIRVINVEGETGTIVGTEENMYIMQSNILTFGSEGTTNLTDALDNMLDLVSEFTYTPFRVLTYGNPMLPLGTNVVFETRYKTINSFVMTRFLSGIQALRDTFTTLGDKKYPEDVNRIKSEIQHNANQTHKLTNDVNTLDSEIFDGQGNSRITQTLEEIVLKVDSAGNIGTIALGTDPVPYDPEDPDPTTQVTKVDINADFLKFKANTELDLEAAKLNITSDNFQLDEEGNLTCNLATMTNANVSGTITSNSGAIGGWYIGNGLIGSPDRYNSINLVAIPQSGIANIDCYSQSVGHHFSLSGNGFYIQTSMINYPVISIASSKIALQAETLSISGTKSRIATTEDYGERLLYCYETPTPMFGDVGEGQIAEDGKCYVWIDPTFAQTIADTQYQVFLQKYGQGECWVSERKPNYFVVEGTQGISFGWEIKAKQLGYEMNRLDKKDDWNLINTNYGEIAERYINDIQNESEVA